MLSWEICLFASREDHSEVHYKSHPQKKIINPILARSEGNSLTCTGKYPSPIVIRPEDAQLDAELARWRLQYLYVPENSKTATNTGTTVKINVDSRGSGG